MITRSDVDPHAGSSRLARFQRTSFVLAGFLAACGGGSKGASSPAAGASQISMSIVGDAASGKANLSGAAFAQFDPDQKALMIYVFDPATQPAPSCDHMGIEAVLAQKSGNSAVIAAKDFSGAPGKIKGAMAMIFQGDASKNPNPPQGMLDATTIELSTFDKTFDAQFTTDSAAKSSITGTLHGTVCPSASIEGQSASGASMPAMPGANGAASYQISIGNSAMIVDSSKALVKLDPKSRSLVIATWSANLPPPTCDQISAPAKGPSPNGAGTVVLLFAKNVAAPGPGKYSVYATEEIAVGDPSTKTQSGALDASVDIHVFDDKAFSADLESADQNSLTGIVSGTVCPNGHIDAPADPTAKVVKKGKKKK